MNNIRPFTEKDLKTIAQFQIDMAKETQNLELDGKLVFQAVQYLFKNQQYGRFLVCTDPDDNACGSLLITIENDQNWWIQSVYVMPDYRRKGNFTRLFNETIRLAKQNKVKRVALYAHDENPKAKQTYYKLGMKGTGEKFYGYDIIYGPKQGLEFLKGPQSDKYTISNKHASSEVTQEIPKVYGTDNNNKKFFIRGNNGQLLGQCQYFAEFSEWRFGMTYYINVFYCMKELEKEILEAFMSKLYSDSPLNVGAIRIIVTDKEMQLAKTVWPNMHDQHYEVIAIDIE